jgi:hypothetical protein
MPWWQTKMMNWSLGQEPNSGTSSCVRKVLPSMWTGIPFLLGANVHDPGLAFFHESSGLGGRNLHPLVGLVGGAEGLHDLSDIQVVITLADLFHRFLRLKAATAATADMVALKQCALRRRKDFEHLLHGGLRSNGLLLSICFHLSLGGLLASWLLMEMSVPEILLNITDEFDEVVDFFGRVVEIEARARR